RRHPRLPRRQAGAGDDMSADTLIDFYCHVSPARFLDEMNKVAPKLGNIAARLRGVRKIHDLDARFKEMDEFGDYRQVVSLPNPPIEDIATPGQGIALARVANDAMAELCQKHPDRFAGFVAALCLTDVMGSVEEAKRAINQLGAAGVQIFSPLAGRSTSRYSSRSTPPWRRSTGRSGCIPRAPRRCRIMPPSRNRASKCGGVLAGPTTPRSPWCGWRFAACSTAIRT